MKRTTLLAIAVLEALLIAALLVALLRSDAPNDASNTEPREARRTNAAATPSAADRPVESGVASVTTPLPPVPSSSVAPSIEGALIFGTLTSARAGFTGWFGLTLVPIGLPVEAPPLRFGVGPAHHEYAIPGLAPGRYRLEADAAGHRSVTHEIEISPGLDRLRFDVQLAANRELLVILETPEGVPLFDALAAAALRDPELAGNPVVVLATLAAPRSPIPNVSLHRPLIGFGDWTERRELPDGAKRPPQHVTGILTMPIEVPCHVSVLLRSAVLATARVEPGQAELRLVVAVDDVIRSFCRVRLRVVDATTGAPASAAQVALNRPQSFSQGQRVDAEGRVELRAPPGVHQLDLRAGGATRASWRVDLRPGVTLDLGDVPLSATRDFELRIDGLPAKGSATGHVRTREAVPHPMLRAAWHAFDVDASGRATLSLVPGRHTLRATAGDRTAVVDFDTQALGDAALVVQLEPAAMFRIVPPPPERMVDLTLTHERGFIAWQGSAEWSTGVRLTFHPGRYEAVIEHPDGRIERRSLVLGAGPFDLDLR